MLERGEIMGRDCWRGGRKGDGMMREGEVAGLGLGRCLRRGGLWRVGWRRSRGKADSCAAKSSQTVEGRKGSGR